MLKQIVSKLANPRILSTSRLGRLFFEDPGEEHQKPRLSYCGSRRFAPSLISPPIKSESRSSKVPLLCVAFGLGLQEKDDDKEQENEGLGEDPVKPVEKEEEETDGFEVIDHVKPVESPVQEPDILLESPLSSCEFCGSKLTLDEKSKTKKGLMSVYTRDGTLFAQHIVKKCLNYGCRAAHFLGYTVKNNIRRYNLDVLQTTKFLGEFKY